MPPLLFFSTLLFYGLQLLPCLVYPAALSFLLFYSQQGIRQKRWTFVFQPANFVTSIRLLLLFGIFFTYALLSPFVIGLLALLILALDGLDGYLARRYQSSSVFGEYLDMETDAFYVLTLCTLLYQLDYLGVWILGIGLLRYGYFLILRNIKTAEQKEERAFLARLIAVVLMATLAACFILPPVVHQPAMVAASVLVLYSFGRSFWSAMVQK